MYPDLLEVFGVTLYGPTFECILFSLVALLMLWGVINSVQIYRAGRRGEAAIQAVITGAILIWSAMRAVATQNPGYELMFSQPLVAHSYAFCILIGIVLGTLTARKIAMIRHDEPQELVKLCIAMVVFGFLGARAAHVIVDHATYIDACFHPERIGAAESDCLRVLNFSEGGLTFYGGVIAGFFVVAWFFIRRYRRGVALRPLSVLDMLAAALAVAHGFGRIGCLAAGCCWGAITTGSIGLHYPAGSFAYEEMLNVPGLREQVLEAGETPLVHATQLYEAGGEFLLYGILWLMLWRGARHGRMVGTWFIAYGVLRFIVEFMRDDNERGYFFEKVVDPINSFFHVIPGHPTILTTSQGIAIGMVVVGTVLLILSKVLRQDPDPVTTANADAPKDAASNAADESKQTEADSADAPKDAAADAADESKQTEADGADAPKDAADESKQTEADGADAPKEPASDGAPHGPSKLVCDAELC